MIVQELLKQCNRKNVAQKEYDDRPEWEKEVPLDVIERAMDIFITNMMELTPILPSNKILIFVPVQDEDDSYVDASLYHHDELKEKYVAANIEDIETKHKAAIEANMIDAFDEIITEVSSYGPSSYAFEFTPWEEVLGYEVDEISLQNIGVDVAAYSVIKEMTFNGFTRESQTERREELEASIAEVEKLKELPEEEQRAHLIPFDEVFDDIRDAWDMAKETEEEKAEKELKWRKEWAANAVVRYKAVHAYMERSQKNG